MNKEIIKIEYLERATRPAFGRIAFDVVYIMTHNVNGRINKYKVTCEIIGIESRDLRFNVQSAKWITPEVETIESELTNDETLTEEAAICLFEDNTESSL